MGESDESDMDLDDMPSEMMKSVDPKRHARAQHNALERRRRDNIKDMYTNLGKTVTETSSERRVSNDGGDVRGMLLQGVKDQGSAAQASRAMILRKAIESIEEKQEECRKKEALIAAIEAENAELERRCRELLAKRRVESSGSGTPSST